MRAVIRVVLLSSISLVCAPLILAVRSDAVDACEALRHTERFEGTTVHLRAVYCRPEHNAFLIAYPKCTDGPNGIAELITTSDTHVASPTGSIPVVQWILCDMTGTFERTSRGGVVFKAKSLTVIRRVKAYKIE